MQHLTEARIDMQPGSVDLERGTPPKGECSNSVVKGDVLSTGSEDVGGNIGEDEKHSRTCRRDEAVSASAESNFSKECMMHEHLSSCSINN